MAETRNEYETLARKPEGRKPFETRVVKWEDDIKMHTKIGLVSCGSGYGPVLGWCEHGNGSLTSMKDQVHDSLLRKKYDAS